MSTITGRGSYITKGVHRQVWEAVGNADTGTPHSAPNLPDKTVSLVGSFGGATIVMQGSDDGVTWFTLTDPQGNNISKTADAVEVIAENPLYIRPSSSGGTGTDVDVTVTSQSGRR